MLSSNPKLGWRYGPTRLLLHYGPAVAVFRIHYFIVPATAAYGSVYIALAPFLGYGIYHVTAFRINSPATTGYGSVSIANPILETTLNW